MMEYVLDLATWRSGGEGDHQTGEGRTSLLNEEGCSCCLGQFAMQMGVDRDSLFGMQEPSDVELDEAYDEAFVTVDHAYPTARSDTSLSHTLMVHNDNGLIPTDKRIGLIRDTLESYDHTLKVIDSRSPEPNEGLDEGRPF